MAWLTKWSFQHGGRTYKSGEVVDELPEAVAARLIELKAIEPQAEQPLAVTKEAQAGEQSQAEPKASKKKGKDK